ncbi:MAG: hypothetical protein ACQERG_08055, partial [Pseudomonadota bacterium]
MPRLNVQAVIGLVIFVGIPSYAVVSAVDAARYFAPEQHWQEQVEKARRAVEWSANRVRAREVELERVEATHDSRLQEERADMAAILPDDEAGPAARENVRLRLELVRGLLADNRAALHE